LGKKHKRQKIPQKRKRKGLTYKEYSRLCRFKFDIEEYTEEFDTDLVKQFGWYDINNPDGVSRDHMLSISYGWKHTIPPKVLRHPANCCLMLYKDNCQKGWRSSINYAGLEDRIRAWNKKYK